MRSSDLHSARTASDGLRIRVVGVGGWGARATELFRARGLPSGAVATRALESDDELRRAFDESEDGLLVIVGKVDSEAGALMGDVLGLAAEAAPTAGRLAIARLPGVQSAPDDRALGLIALNALLDAPESSILLVQTSRGMGISAETEAGEAVERVIRLLDLPGQENESEARLSPAALRAHLSTPGFAGWREIDLSSEMCAEEAPCWLDALPERGVAWQPEGFAWGDAQSILAVARLPREWIDSGGREHFDRFVQEAWSQAAPCAIARSLQSGEPPLATVISTGLAYPEKLLDLRDSVQADRERLAEKRRAAATPIPLGDDFLSAAPPARAHEAREPRAKGAPSHRGESAGGRPEAAAPPPRTDAGTTRLQEPAPEPESVKDRPAEAYASGDRDADRARREEGRAGVAALSHETAGERLEFEPVPEGAGGFAETQVVVATATETESEVEPETEVRSEPEIETEATTEDERSLDAVEVAPTAAEEVPEAVEEAAEVAEEPSPRAREAPTAAPYQAALSLARRVHDADDLATEIDLGEIRYALYDLLEVVRDRPGPILAEVFRRSEADYFERHHVNVAILSILTADELGATLSDVIDLGTAAMLHDIGMSDSREAWDADVRLAPKVFDTTIRQHPERGYERIRQIPGMTADIARIVREEHERLDGTGYPEGLSGDAIDPGARIVAVADTLEALTHARPYRERLSLGEALSRLQILGQYTLDMAVVQTLTDALTGYMPTIDSGSDEA